MTAAIKASLTNLNQALQDLESAATHLQNNKKTKSKGGFDLFSMSGNDVDTRALASRLDGAIAKVEKLLRDEEAHG